MQHGNDVQADAQVRAHEASGHAGPSAADAESLNAEVKQLQQQIDTAVHERDKAAREYYDEVEGIGAWCATAKQFYHDAKTARRRAAKQQREDMANTYQNNGTQ